MKKEVVTLLFVICFVIAIGFVSTAAIGEDLHLNIQAIDGTGAVVTGTFNYSFNISADSTCTNIVYSNRSELTTDTRGIISYYLNGVSLNF